MPVKTVEIDFRDENFLLELSAGRCVGMQLAKLRHHCAIHDGPGRSSRMVVVNRLRVVSNTPALELPQQLFEVPFQIEEGKRSGRLGYTRRRRAAGGAHANSPQLQYVPFFSLKQVP